MFTAGRYEYRNKGVDMFIESLARTYMHSSRVVLSSLCDYMQDSTSV